MAISLDANVQAQLEKQYGIIPLILFQIPGLVRGYYGGPYAFDYLGQTYQPNRFLDIDDLVETLDDDAAERTVTFSNIPLAAETMIEELVQYNYTGAPVTISRLVFDPDLGATGGIVGVGETSFHEVYDATLSEEPDEDNNMRALVEITLRAPGFIGRRRTNTLRTLAEHQSDFDATDTFYEHVADVETVEVEWGRRSG